MLLGERHEMFGGLGVGRTFYLIFWLTEDGNEDCEDLLSKQPKMRLGDQNS